MYIKRQFIGSSHLDQVYYTRYACYALSFIEPLYFIICCDSNPRFAYDGLKRQRLTTPMIRDADGNLAPCTWEEALVEVASKMHSVQPEEMTAVAGGLSDAESLVALKDLLNSFNSEGLYTEEVFPDSGTGYGNYLIFLL